MAVILYKKGIFAPFYFWLKKEIVSQSFLTSKENIRLVWVGRSPAEALTALEMGAVCGYMARECREIHYI